MVHPLLRDVDLSPLLKVRNAIAQEKKLFGPFGSGPCGLRDKDFIDTSLPPLPSLALGSQLEGWECVQMAISSEEEKDLLTRLETMRWDVDNEGRRVQIYGYFSLLPHLGSLSLPYAFFKV